jgi:hypothetical protein
MGSLLIGVIIVLLSDTGKTLGRKQRKLTYPTLIDVDNNATGAVHDGFHEQAAEKLV